MPGVGSGRSRPVLTALMVEADHQRAVAAAYIEQGKQRYSGVSRWLTKHARNQLASLHLISLPSPEEVRAQGEQLCREYILQRLRTADLLSTRMELLAAAGLVGEKFDNQQPTAVVQELLAAGAVLEGLYPDLYDSVTAQLGVSLTCEQDVRRALCSVARYLYKGSVTWGKVVAGLALAAALASDCVKDGHPEFVKYVIEAFSDVTRDHTASWIVQQGGWADVIQACRANNEAPLLWAFSVIGATIGFSLTLIATVNV